VMELAPTSGYRVEEGAYPLSLLLEAEEAFTSSSIREVMPLVELDGRPVERGPAADVLQAALRDLAAKV
jgi:branched-subunit amino acid aminotransferase/4-amino-4-deoxychorismate lyase